MYFQIFTVDVLLFIRSFRDLWVEKEFHGRWGLAGPLGLAGRLHQLQTRTCCRNRIFRVQTSWSKQSFRVQCLWNVLKHQDTITLAPLLLPRPRVARCPIDFLQNQMCRYQRSVMFTCLLGSSAFIAIQNDPNLLYNTVFFLSLCLFCLAMNSVWLKWKVTMDAILLRAHHPDLSLIYFGSRSSALLNCHKLVTVFLNISQLCVTISQECVSYPGAQVGPPALMCSKLRHKTLLSALICFRCCQLCLVLPCFRWMVFSIPSDLLADKSKF